MSYLYRSFPLEPANAKGCTVFSKQGISYTDTFAGIGVTLFGHSYPPLLERLHEKLNRYIHLSNFVEDPDLSYVANTLLSWTGRKGEVFFTNSGTEATETALKVLLKARSGIREKIIYFSDSFHGRTLGALAVNGSPSLRTSFEPLLPFATKLPWNDTSSLKDYFSSHGGEVLGMIVEPIQGSAGIIPMEKSFAKTINKLKASTPFYLIADEVQSGLGRTGTLFAYEHFSLQPDIILLGKALGGGLPLGAALLLGECSTILKPGDHGSTFAPNPVALAGARFVCEQLPGMLGHVTLMGEYFREKLSSLPSERVMEIRGRGLMIGLELRETYPTLAQEAFENHHLLLNVIKNKVIRLLPPLNTTKEDIDLMTNKLEKMVNH